MGEAPLGKMIVELGLDDTNFAKGVTGVQKQLATLKNDLKTSQTSFTTFGRGVDGIKSPMEILTKSIEKQKEQLALLKKSYSGSFIDGKATSSTQGYVNQISRANAQLMQFQSQLKGAAIEQYKQTSILPKMSTGLGKVSSGLDFVGSKAMPATIAVAGIFAKGIQDASNFNGQMTTIQALLSDGTPEEALGKQMDTLSDKSKEWARQYGIGTTSINEGIEEVVKKGYSYNQTIGAMPSLLDAAKASGEDFGTVMENSTSILEEFNLKTNDTAGMIKNTQRVTDSLSYVANATAAGFGDMGEAMEYVGPVANGLGMSVEQTAASIGLLSNNGLKGQTAGTGLRTVLTSLLNPSKEAAGAMADLGVNLKGFKAGTIGLPDVIASITSHTKGMTDAQKSALLAQAFGTKGQTAMNVLVSQGADKLNDLTKATDGATGYTKKLADQMNNSDKNAFARAKASLETLSIDLGQKLLPSIVPVVQKIDDLAGSFEKLDPKTQQFILKMALTVAAIGPTAKALSGLTGILSTVTGGLAKLGEKGAAKLAFSGIATEAEGATAAIGGVGGLEAGIGGLAPILAGISPVAVGALGVAGLAGLIIGVKGAIDDAQERMKYFGTIEVPEETNSQLVKFKGKVDDAKTAMDEFGSDAPGSVEKVKKAISGLANDTNSDIDKATDKVAQAMKRSGYTDAQIAEMKTQGTKAKKVVTESTDDISQVYVNASKRDASHRKLSVDEQARISADMKVVFASEADAIGVTGEKKNNLIRALNGDFNKMSKSQAQQVVDDMRDMRKQANDEADQQVADQKTLLAAGEINQDEYNQNIAAIEQERLDKQHKYGDAVAKAEQVLQGNLKLGEAGYAEWRQKAEGEMALYEEKTGMGLDDVLAKLASTDKKTGDSRGLLAKYVQGMSDDTKKADDAWNAMIFDPKTGTIKTNVPQAIAEALKGKDGWDNLQFILKNANMTTNAREEVAQALIASGQWDQLTPDEKNLVVNGQQGLLAIFDSKQNLAEWNGMPAAEKKLLGDNKDFLQNKGTAEQSLISWNNIPDPIKKLLGDNSDFKGITAESSQILTAWNSAEPAAKKLLAVNLAKDPTMSAQQIIDSLTGKNVFLSANNNTEPGVNSAATTIASLHGKTVGLDANDESARRTFNAFMDLPASKTISIIADTTKHATGTDYHQGGLAMVNDQRGPQYKELVTLPTGQSFIPEGRDVILPLPRGSKVLKASKTAQFIPKYADGVGSIPADAKIFRDMRAVQQQLVVNTPAVDNSELLSKILQAILNNGNNDLAKAINRLANVSQNTPTLRERSQALDTLQKELGYLFSNN